MTSIPIFTRSGRPSFSLASSPPSGRTFAAFRVSASRVMRGLDYPGPGALSEKSAPAQASADPQAQTPRTPRSPRSPGPVGFHLRAARRARREAAAARAEREADAGEHVRLRERRPFGPRDSPRRPGADHRPVGRDQRVDEARDRRGRGQAVLPAPRRRPPWHGPRGVGRRHAPRHGAGRLDDHPAARQERVPDEPEDDRPEAHRGGPRMAARAALVEGQDPDRVPQHRLLRERRVRRRAGLKGLLPPQRPLHEAGGSGAARRDPRGPERVGSRRASSGGRGATQPGPAASLPTGLPDGEPARQLAQLPDAGPGERLSARDAGQVRAVLRQLREGPARPALRTRRSRSGAG